MAERPIVNWELVKVVVNSFIIWLVVMNIWPMTEIQQAATLTLGTALVNALGAFYQNKSTTPLAKPSDNDGTPLVRQDTLGPTRSAAKRA